MKNSLVLVLFSCFAILCMETPRPPQRGQKRPATAITEPILKVPAVEPRTAFELLPNEIKTEILKNLTIARGATKRARLDNAAENIRTFFRINTQFKPIGDDPQIIEYLITELANNYADGDKLAAAIALGTEGTGKWLENILTTNNPQLFSKKYKIAQKLSKHFIDAAKDGRINVIKFLLQFASAYEFPWQQALRGAFKNNRVEIVRLIVSLPRLQQEITKLINTPDNNGETMLFDAIRNSNEPVVDLLLSARANVNIVDKFDRSIVHLAAAQNNPSILKKILAAGVRPDLLNLVDATSALTPLMMVIDESGNIEMLKMLLDAGANVNQTNEDGDTALSFAKDSNRLKNQEMVIKTLKEYGAR